MFDRILVALNTKEDCAPIFKRALALAAATHAQIHLLGVVSRESEATLPLMAFPGITGYPLVVNESLWAESQENYKKIRDKGMHTLSGLTQEAIAAGVSAEFSQELGDAGKVICDRAKNLDADLIMVGSHGRRGLDEILMGSVSSYVMHRAPCSVMVVHDKTNRAVATGEAVRHQAESCASLT